MEGISDVIQRALKQALVPYKFGQFGEGLEATLNETATSILQNALDNGYIEEGFTVNVEGNEEQKTYKISSTFTEKQAEFPDGVNITLNIRQ